jgi:hypothetical protein
MEILFEIIVEIFGGITEDFVFPALSKKIDARIKSKALRNLVKILILLLCLGIVVGVAAALIFLISLIIRNMH